MPPSSMQSLNEAPALTPPPRPLPPADSMNAEKSHPVGYSTRTSALFNSAALAGLPWLSPGADPAGHLCNTEDLAFARCWASVVCGYWDTYEGQDLVGSELVERLVSGGIFANPRMTRCRPALDTASSWERCQRAKLRRPQHALGEPCFDQLLSGLRRSARHSRSVKGGGASNGGIECIDAVMVPPYKPSLHGPAGSREVDLSLAVCVSVRLLGLPCLGVQVPTAVLPGPPGPTPPGVLATWVGRSTLYRHHGRELLCLLPSRLRDLPRESVCLTRAFILFLV